MPDSLLGQATRYLCGSLLLVRGADLSAPTPCGDWDLRRLLRHVGTSLAEVTDVLRGADRAPDARSGADPVAAARTAAVDFLLAAGAAGRWCEIQGRSLQSGVVVSVGAIEAVLHAWDIAQACRIDRPIPADVASVLLWVSPPLADAGRDAHVFAGPVASPATATPSDQLLALFGRRPASRYMSPDARRQTGAAPPGT